MLAAIGQDLLRTALLGQLLLLVLLLDALEPALTRGADCAPTTSSQSSAANTVRRQRARPRGQRSERRDNGLGMGSRVAHGGPPSPCRRRPAREPWPTSPGPAGGTCCARTPAGRYRADVGLQAPTASRALRAPIPSLQETSRHAAVAPGSPLSGAPPGELLRWMCVGISPGGQDVTVGRAPRLHPVHRWGVRSPFRARVDARD